jgi:hypothetical protein
MNRLNKWLVGIAAALVLSACTTYSSIETGSRKEVGDMSVQVVGNWAAINASVVPLGGADAMWTVDGISLNRLMFFGGVEAGEPLQKTGNDENDSKLPTFRIGMTENGVMELVETTFAKSKGVARSVASNLRPRPFLGRQGFAFEVDIVNEEQIEVRVLVAGTTVGKKLYLIYFGAPKLHFFDKEVPTVNAIIDSARLSGPEA